MMRQVSTLVLASVLALLLPSLLAAADGKVNINTAAVEQLSLLPRVGPSVAQRIVDYRDENGKFESLEELLLVRGIGDKTFALIQPFVSISGETTLKEKVSAGGQEAR